MAYVLVFFGIIGSLAGAYGTFQAFARSESTLYLAQSIGVLLGGLLLIAAGEALTWMADMSRNTRKLQEDMRRLADRVAPPSD